MLRPLLAAMLLCLWLAGCASTTTFITVRNESAAIGEPARRIIVAGVSADDELRRRYETVFEQELARAGLDGFGSHRRIPGTRGLSLAEIRERMHAAAADADLVIHVQLAGIVVQPALSPQDIPAEGTPAHRNVKGIEFTLNAPASGQVRGTQYEIELIANAYALPSRKLLWTATSRTREANRIEDISRSHARAVIGALRAAGHVAAADSAPPAR